MLHSEPLHEQHHGSLDFDAMTVEDKARRFADNGAELRRRDAERSDASRKANPIAAYVPLPHQLAFHESPAKERWGVTANGAGKTQMGAAECVMLACGISTWWDWKAKGAPEIWCGAVSHSDSAALQRTAIRKLIPPALVKSWPHETDTGNESVLTLTNGVVIRFKATRQGRESWQGGNVALVWFDEEPDGEVFDEGFSRTRTGGRVIVTFTPMKGLKWDVAYQRVYVPWLAFKSAHPMTKWGEVAPGLFMMTAGMADNTHPPEEAIESQRNLFKDRPLILRARLFGEWIDTSEDAIVPVDKIGEHDYTLDAPPRGGWNKRAIWIDSAFSAKQTADRTCISHAGSDYTGKLYLIEQAFGHLEPGQRISASVKAIREAGCPPTYVQRTTPDMEFATRLNDALMRAGLPALVQCHPEKGGVPGKVERANAFAVIVGNGQVAIRADHKEFKREAGTFPHAEHDDVFDSGMGALMVLCDPAGMSDLRQLLNETRTPMRGEDDAFAPFDWQAERGLLDLGGSE